MPTVVELAAIAPAAWVQEGVELIARWGVGLTSMELVVRIPKDNDAFHVEASIDRFIGNGHADHVDELPRALREAFSEAVLSVPASGLGVTILEGVREAPAWLRGAARSKLDREFAECDQKIRATAAHLHQLQGRRDMLVAQAAALKAAP